MASEPVPESANRRRSVAQAAPGSASDAVLFDSLPVATALIDAGGAIRATNRAWTSVTGLTEAESADDRWLGHLDPQHRDLAASRLRRALLAGETGGADWRLGGANPRWTRWWWHPTSDGAALIVCVADIDADRTRERELWYRATHDPLTGLVNRSEFLDLVERALDRSARTEQRLAVIFADLVGFKIVNDRGGHCLGDRVLRSVAGRLRAAVRPADVVARIGGDEFAVLCEDLTDDTEPEWVATRLQAAVASIQLEGEIGHRSVAVSTGVATAGKQSEAAEDLVARADRAMYRSRGVMGHDELPRRGDHDHSQCEPDAIGLESRSVDAGR